MSILRALVAIGLACVPVAGLERQPPGPGFVLARFTDLSYPTAAIDRGLQGFVVLRLTVAVTGQVQSSEVLHGDAVLAAAAADNAKTWTFRPGSEGQPLLVYRFEIDDGWCNDPQRSLFRLRYGWANQMVRAQMLATVTACSRPAMVAKSWPDDDLRVISRPGMDYPPIAHAARIQGIVLARVSVDSAGRVSQAQLLHESPLLQDAVLANARRWEFEPSRPREAILVFEFSQDLPMRDCEFRSVDGLIFPRYIRVQASGRCVDV